MSESTVEDEGDYSVHPIIIVECVLSVALHLFKTSSRRTGTSQGQHSHRGQHDIIGWLLCSPWRSVTA